MEVELTIKQRKVLREIFKIQLASLKAMLDNDCIQDVPLYCIEHEMDHEALKRLVSRNIEDFEYVYEYPEHLFLLKESHLSMVKHILHKHIKDKTLRRAKSEVWRKLVLNEQLTINLQ